MEKYQNLNNRLLKENQIYNILNVKNNNIEFKLKIFNKK